MKNKYKYEELSPELKKNLLNMLITRLTFDGRKDPEKKALERLMAKEPKSRKRWRTTKYIYKASVKMRRKNLGMTEDF